MVGEIVQIQGTVMVFKHNYKSFDTPAIGSLDLNSLHWNLDELITTLTYR